MTFFSERSRANYATDFRQKNLEGNHTSRHTRAYQNKIPARCREKVSFDPEAEKEKRRRIATSLVVSTSKSHSAYKSSDHEGNHMEEIELSDVITRPSPPPTPEKPLAKRIHSETERNLRARQELSVDRDYLAEIPSYA